MPILTLQQRATELGRIRIGRREPFGDGGKTRPAKLRTFRLTSPSRSLIDRAAELYGGQVEPWTPAPGAGQQWEVITTATEIPVLMPPQPLTQWFETWSAGGCTRRCDGQTETLTGQPCLCDPDPDRRDCLATTRLNVVLRDVPGVGVWRLESHGYYAAVELPALAEFLGELGDSGGYLRAALVLRERVAVRRGKTLRYVVPGIEIAATPAELMAARGAGGGVGELAARGPAAVEQYTPPAIEAPGYSQPVDGVGDDGPPVGVWLDTISAVTEMGELTRVYQAVKTAGLARDMNDANNPVVAALRDARDRLRKPAPAATRVELPPAGGGESREQLWFQILAASREDLTTTAITEDVETFCGAPPDRASIEDLRRYLGRLTG